MTHKYKHRAPNPLYTALEGRWIIEMGAHYATRPLLKKLPRGDGHSVIVFPGFMTSKISTRHMRRLLGDLGYDVHDWGMGRNLRFSAEIEEKMQKMVADRAKDSGQKVSLIGWSLGGVFAREIARIHPEIIRNVISLGSPITGARHAALARPLFELLNGQPEPDTEARIDQMHVPPPVPTTAIYSKTDGIVHWHGALQSQAKQAENIRVPASHLGMGTNPLVMYILANRLAQREGEWRPFDTSGLRKLVYRNPGIFRRSLGDFY